MRNVRLDEAQAEIKLVRRNISNLRYEGEDHSNGRSEGTKELTDESEEEE